MTPTYRRSTWEAADAAWISGNFGPEWKPVRRLAASQGILFPPHGSGFDPWDDDHPSQRAVVARSIADTPHLLERAIAGARGWNQVIERLLLARDRHRERLAAEATTSSQPGPSRDEAVVVLARLTAEIH